MTKTTIELEIEQIKAIVVDELKSQYHTLRHDVDRMLEQEAAGTLPAWKVEDLRNNTRTLNAILGVLQFYMSDADLITWLTSYDFLFDEDDIDVLVVSVADIVEPNAARRVELVKKLTDVLTAANSRKDDDNNNKGKKS